MPPKRTQVEIHSKKADKLGRTKDRRHGTEAWTTWVGKPRISKAGRSPRTKAR